MNINGSYTPADITSIPSFEIEGLLLYALEGIDEDPIQRKVEILGRYASKLRKEYLSKKRTLRYMDVYTLHRYIGITPAHARAIEKAALNFDDDTGLQLTYLSMDELIFSRYSRVYEGSIQTRTTTSHWLD
jgi:hypothetical protein